MAVGRTFPVEEWLAELLLAKKLTYTKEAMLRQTSRPVNDLRVTSFFMI